MIIPKEEVEKAAVEYALQGKGYSYKLEGFEAGVEFSEEYVQQHVQDIIIENQGLKLYKDNEAERFKKLAIEFANWCSNRLGPDEKNFDKFIKERNETNS
jgi:hypothetical protein